MTYETPAQKQARMYEEAVSRQARIRQEDLWANRHPCCGEHVEEGHHEACSLRPKDVTPVIHPDQEALA